MRGGTIMKSMAAGSALLWSILFSNMAFSQTHVTGAIEIDAKWTTDKSPYILSGEVVVEPDTSLDIERNVAIIFMQGARFVIKGDLEAYRVFFNGVFNASNEETLFFPSGSTGRLIRCVFLDLSLVFDSSDIQLTSSAVSNRNGTGVTVGKEFSPHMAHNSFHGNSYFAIYRKGKAPLKVTNCFWGAETGPSGEGDGDGDAVSSHIVYRPFKSKEELDFIILAMTAAETGDDPSGKTLRLTYTIYNLNCSDHKAVLGASLLGSDKRAYNHPASDIRITIPPGLHEYTRKFELPSGMQDGVYDVHWGVMNKDSSGYHTYVKKERLLEVLDGRLRRAKRDQLPTDS